MPGEYADKLKAFASQVNGEFSYGKNPSTTLRGKGWSKAEIRIPNPGREIRFIAFSGANSAEVYSGFYCLGKIAPGVFCRITEKDGLSRLVSTFSSYNMKSGRTDFDKKLHVACNNKNFLLKLTGDHDTARFLVNTIRRPLRFEVMTNEKGILQGEKASAMVISLNTNEWIVDEYKLNELLAGFRLIVNHMG